jgi:3-isopropylmalate/(R)-2-methylmalate dehydratase small subunit
MALPNLNGRAALLLPEQDFDVDQIVGIANLKTTDAAELARHALRWCGEEFAQNVRPGDLIVAGPNFGYGHPHYPTMIAMRHLGIAGVVGESFSPGYWLGEISKGFPQVCCPGILESTRRWDTLEVDWEASEVRNHTRGVRLRFEPLAPSEMQTLEAGGLLKNLKNARSSA